MHYTIIYVVGCLMLCASAPPQDKPRELRGDGHLLGETAELFFSEGFVGDMLRACQVSDWKSVSKNVGHTSKADAKDYCAKEKLAKQQATSGIRLDYEGRGDEETMRSDTFTFDSGHLVKIDMAYMAPVANIAGRHPKSYGELFAGLQEAYGPPSKSYSEPTRKVRGAPRCVDGQSRHNQHHRAARRGRTADENNCGNTCRIQSLSTGAKDPESFAITKIQLKTIVVIRRLNYDPAEPPGQFPAGCE